MDFDLVLENDLANIVKKSAAGQPLTAREREMILSEKAKREKAAVPAPVSIVPKKSGRAALTDFKESYDFYAERYGSSPRTVKRWVKTGKDLKIPCPLDDAGSMRAWWSKCMTLKCPDRILAAEVEFLASGGKVTSPEVPAEVEEVSSVEIEVEEVGLAGAMKRLEQMEVMFAKKAGDPGQAKNWFDAISRMTSVAFKLRQELEAQGKLVPKVEVAAELQSFHGQIVSVLKSYLSEDQCREVFEMLNKEVFS